MNFNSLRAVSVIVTLVVHLNVVNSQIETNEIPKEKHNYPSPSMQILKADNGLKNIVNDMFTPTNTTLQTNFENKNTNNQKRKIKKKKKTYKSFECFSQQYLNQLIQIADKKGLSIPKTEKVSIKKAINRVKKVFFANDISNIPKCLSTNDEAVLPSKGNKEECINRESYFLSLLLYITRRPWLQQAASKKVKIETKTAVDKRDVNRLFEILMQVSISQGIETPPKCEFNDTIRIENNRNCTLHINLQDHSSIESIMQQLNNLIEDEITEETLETINKRYGSNIVTSSCEKNHHKEEPLGDYDIPGYMKYMVMNVNNTKLRKDYGSLLLSKNVTWYTKKEMLKNNNSFYLLLVPEKASTILHREQREVPEVFREFVWEASIQEFNKTIWTNRTFQEILFGKSATFFMYLYSDEQNKKLDKALDYLVIISLMCGMTSLGCTMTFEEIFKHAKKPKGVVIALLSQFIIMPAASYLLGVVFQLEMYAAIAVLIAGCCPGGNLSNLLAYALRGDMNLSILMTTCSSIVGLGMMPLNIFLYSKLIIPVDAGSIVPYGNIILNITLTLVPVLFGILIRNFRPQWVDYVLKGGFTLMISAQVGLAFCAGFLFKDSFFRFFPMELVGVCVCFPFIGYSLGYFISFISREKPKCCRTIMVETGCQNVQLASTVLRLAFDPLAINILFLMPLIYMVFQLLEAFVVIGVLRLVDHCKNKGKLIETKDMEDSDSFSNEISDKDSISKSRDNKELLTLVIPEAYNKQFQNGASNNQKRQSVEALDIKEAWPLQGNPSESCLNSFEQAKSEKFL